MIGWTAARLDEPLIRSELFSVERLEQHAASLAEAQRVTRAHGRGTPLHRRLTANGKALLATYHAIGAAIREGHAITPAAEWLVDNFHVIEEQIRHVRANLPPGYYRQLPKLAEGPLRGHPRVFGLAWAYVAHTDSRFDPESLCRFVHAYQRVQPLTIGELWALATTLRLVLVENLRRAADQILRGRAARQQADALADQILDGDPVRARLSARALARISAAPLDIVFAVQLVQRLRDQDPSVTPALPWLDDRLAAQGTTADDLVREEHRRLGASNVTVRNVITSLRLMSDLDWTRIFESSSLVDETLRDGSDFAAMDFATRDRYRHAIEELARGSRATELEVAHRVLRACREAAPDRERERDPGYHLISRGREALERGLGFRWSWRARRPRLYRALGLPGYLAAMALLTATLCALASMPLAGTGLGAGWIAAFLALAAIPASNAAVALINRHVSRVFGARVLPGLELKAGVPSELRTLVVVPTLLASEASVEEQVEHLEVCHLANTEGDLRYALLSDWTDAATETTPGDEALLAIAVSGIARLNARYGPARDGERFVLLHRRRVWSESEGLWFGWERKRGKLHELNRWLRGATDTPFVATGDAVPLAPHGVRYVITLDSDTRLPRETARRLVGKMAHPLNRPRLDPARGRVVEGHAVLQPRVSPGLPLDRDASRFQRAFSGASGIDPYASAVSDVYQDLFGEGSYTGKGIYDVDAFEEALRGRIPDGTVLSHDLLEGIFARAGLASDIEVVDDFPTCYHGAATRQHRWARGDWQLLPWILGRGRVPGGERARRAMPWIGRWKMIDNLRRTLLAPSVVLALVLGWTLPRPAAVAWTGFVLAFLTTPALLPALDGLLPRGRRPSVRGHLRSIGAGASLALAQSALLVGFVADEAWSMGDAILRTLRRLRSGRHLLEWRTAAQSDDLRPRQLGDFYRCMKGGVAVGLTALGVVFACRGTWELALPFVALWLTAPAIARWTSLPSAASRPGTLAPEDIRLLRGVARRTWRYFEIFVQFDDHMLPPDNFQEDPAPVVAHRTSPTNIGLYLLSCVGARDFGWVGTVDTVERLEATLATLERMERRHGHFLNWYDTRDLRPLDPAYVSTVDSGNLAGHLIALAAACREMAGRPGPPPGWSSGLADTARLIRESLRAGVPSRRTATATRAQLDGALDALEARLETTPGKPLDTADRLRMIAHDAETVADVAYASIDADSDPGGAELHAWADALWASVRSHQRDLDEVAARALGERLESIAERAEELWRAMDFGFLFDSERELFSIGYRVADGSLDPSCYDLLASEARLASFVAIAKGDVPARHWFRLGRRLTPVHGGAALTSWSGSMFEYLMPALVMHAPARSLLEHTHRLVVRRQIEYGAELRMPWGVSESAYNARDLELTYQYSDFGVPGLGLKRGLGEDAVVAPYATALAAMVDPAASARNLERLDGAGGRGRYGFYEALDYTARRLPQGATVAIVRAHMAHHQGMTLVAIANALLGDPMPTRFHSDPAVRATELLLQERVPREVAITRPRAEEMAVAGQVRGLVQPAPRRFRSPHHPIPRTHLLSNGRYAVLLTAAGSGYSRWRDLAITRWREDATEDAWGSYVFLRDVSSGEVWSAGFQPAGVEPAAYEVVFVEDGAEIRRRDGSLTTHLTVAVSPEDDGEVRRVSITNHGSLPREIDVTSYAELVLAPRAADDAHPAFSKLFVRTEHVPEVGALLATRRPRAPDDAPVWAAHLAVVEGESVGPLQIETDRARFIGRGHDLRTAVAVHDGAPLTGTTGDVLDPVFSLRRRVRVPPGATARVAFWTLAATTRAEALDLVDKHHDLAAYERATTLSWTQAQVQLHHLGVGPDDAHLFQRLANHILYSDPSLGARAEVVARNELPRSALWAHGISGDLPIVLVRIDDAADLGVVRQVLLAQRYLRLKQLAVDVVILNDRAPSYAQDLQHALETAARGSRSAPPPAEGSTAPGDVFVLRADLVSAPVRRLLRATARAVLLARRGSLSEQLDRVASGAPTPSPRRRRPAAGRHVPAPPPETMPELWNGLGGFVDAGREYVTVLEPGQQTPAPWINVIANPALGTQVSADGGGYTWALDSRENQLTPWSNDPVVDRAGEVLYVRDEDSGTLLGATARPVRNADGHYECRHGQGYSRFTHAHDGLDVELLVFVPLEDPIKIARLTIRNRSKRVRRLSVTAYAEWVLGAARPAAAPFVVTEIDAETGALFARNRWRERLGGRVAFADLAGKQRSWTADRREFLGRHGTLADPAALASAGALSGRVGARLDPCAALRTSLELAPNTGDEVVFFLGEADSEEQARTLIHRYRSADLDAVLEDVRRRWDELLGTVQVRTPDRPMDLMLNRWFLYQTLASRLWARAGFYQASGAFGFRDQLQDGMSLVTAAPALTRAQLLRAAARQFVEGDVQHWWQPLTGSGVRTRISDDLAWLPYVAAHYVETTGDLGVLDESVPFLESPPLAPEETDRYFTPAVSSETATLFEHGARALDRSLGVGRHGLPLMGSGDWNDGMNRVGEGGSGESVWLAWFLHAALTRFAPLAERRGELERAATWRRHAAALAASVERESWDGEWYRRGYFDDGTPLGSVANDECKIDSIAQSWAVLSGAADATRAARAMAAVDEHLVRRDHELIQLFAPPFDRTELEPGYIKGYPPGVRENGGQYTHAAAWAVIAFAELGDGDKASELFGMLNPIRHSSSRASIRRYKVEPYVTCADLYATHPHAGRGGWTWYTGSAAWLYRAGLESILGFRPRGGALFLDPCIPPAWDGFEIAFRHGGARYEIAVENPRHVARGVATIEVDGVPLATAAAGIPLVDDGAVHRVRVILG